MKGLFARSKEVVILCVEIAWVFTIAIALGWVVYKAVLWVFSVQ